MIFLKLSCACLRSLAWLAASFKPTMTGSSAANTSRSGTISRDDGASVTGSPGSTCLPVVRGDDAARRS